MSAILIGKNIIHYEVLGRGRPVIFLHSWFGSWRYWISSMQAVSASYRAYALDLCGFGDTAKDPNQYSLGQQVELLYGFLYQMGIGKVAIVAHGMGSLVSMRFSKTYGDMVDRMMVVAYPLNLKDVNNRLRIYKPMDLLDWLINRNNLLEPVQNEITKIDPLAVHISYDEMGTMNLNQMLVQLNKPCLSVYSVNDPLVSTPNESDLSGISDNFQVIYFDNSSHFPMLEESNRFNRLLVDFLALAGSESPRQLQLKDEWKRRVR
jgi:pimeloyl-ACP methyl ester carboxylesterase